MKTLICERSEQEVKFIHLRAKRVKGEKLKNKFWKNFSYNFLDIKKFEMFFFGSKFENSSTGKSGLRIV
jgi:hypothetical protein